MKSANLWKLLALVAVVGALVGCRKHPVGVTPLPGQRPGAVAGPGPGGMIGAPTGPGATGLEGATGFPLPPRGSHAGWGEDRETLQQYIVYFDFDRSAIKPNERPKIEAVAAYLRANPNKDVKVEGHCDERGTEEYNRALGERRALAVREELIRNGIAPERIETISYGEDRPAELGHNEEAWAKNRRAEFVLLSPP